MSLPAEILNALRRAFTQVRNGRPRPTMIEIPSDVMTSEIPDDFVYTPAPRVRVGPDLDLVKKAAEVLVAA